MKQSPVQARWLELEVEVAAEASDDAAAALFEAGAAGVEIVDSESAAPPEEALPDAAPARRPNTEGHALLVASYTEVDEPEAAAAAARAAFEEVGAAYLSETLRWRWRDDTDWAERWKQYFEPLCIGERLWIVPSWRRDFTPPADSIVLQLDPGMAFGTGQHATTALCLELLDSPAVLGAGSVRNLLDVGSGSGILAIAAAKLGVPHVVAIDNDPDAVRASAENAEANGVAAQVLASDTPLDALHERFDLVLANILAVTLEALAAELLRALAPGGTLVMSGVLAEQLPHLEQVFAEVALAHARALRKERVVQRGDWVAVQMRG